MLSLNPRNITQIKMTRQNNRQYHVSINCCNNHVFEANMSVQEINEHNEIRIAPWPERTRVFVLLTENIETVLDLPAAAATRLILIEPSVACVHLCSGVYVDIVFGSPVSKASFCRMLKTNSSGEDSGMSSDMSSDSPSPPQNEQNPPAN